MSNIVLSGIPHLQVGEEVKSVLDFHRKTPSFGILRDRQGTTLSLNPSHIDIFNGEPIVKDPTKVFTATNANTNYTLLPTKPPHIFLLAHNRPTYLELTLNSLLFSLQPNAAKVPISLVLIDPSEGVLSVANSFLRNHPHLRALQVVENTHMATPLFILQYLETINELPETFMVYEDDFILPSSVKNSYPNWPWWFAQRLAVHDMVAWLPSMDNCPSSIKQYINQHILRISRTSIPGSRWLDNRENYHLAMSGNAVACNTQRYRLSAKRSNLGYPVDTELSSLASNVSCPTIFGYHIGWNQEQDGYAKLEGRAWPKVSKQATIIDLVEKKTSIINL